MRMRHFLQLSASTAASTILALLPIFAEALTTAEIKRVSLLFLYGAAGLFGAASMIMMGAGLIIYFVRIGTEHRKEGITWMEWAVTTIFVVAILALILAYID